MIVIYFEELACLGYFFKPEQKYTVKSDTRISSAFLEASTSIQMKNACSFFDISALHLRRSDSILACTLPMEEFPSNESCFSLCLFFCDHFHLGKLTVGKAMFANGLFISGVSSSK